MLCNEKSESIVHQLQQMSRVKIAICKFLFLYDFKFLREVAHFTRHQYLDSNRRQEHFEVIFNHGLLIESNMQMRIPGEY